MNKIKIILLALAALLLVGCDCGGDANINRYRGYTRDYFFVEIDGCEYIRSGNRNFLTHKGNCSNPIHNNHARDKR